MTFKIVLARRVLHFIAGLSEDEKGELRHAIASLRADPYVDNLTKFPYPAPPLVFNLYQDGPFRIIYRIKDNDTVIILNISPAPYVPPPHEWDKWRNN